MGKGARQRRERQQEQNSFRLTREQEKAMRKEINAQVLEADRRYWMDVDATVMWALHKECGFGEKRLKRFYEGLAALHEEMRKHYELDEENTWLCRYLLKKQTGIDLEIWEKEFVEQHAG